jgi:glycosyltransferase involved in cell wall biosynthesis
MRTLHLVLPDTVDDPARPSGGNVYDRRVADGLAALGWRVVEHVVPGAWPRPDEVASVRLSSVMAEVPDGEQVLVDGLVASATPEALVPAARRISLGVLVHLPLGVDDASARSAEREVLLAARTVVATSEWTRRWLADHYGLPAVQAAPPGVDPAPVAAGSGTGSRLLAVGRACPAKGYDVLAEALVTLTDLPWTCEWVGPVEEARPSRIVLTGPLSAAELAEHYHAADLLVLPSRGETYGMVLSEALARGLPVLASDVGGVREAIGARADGLLPGLLVESGDAEALARGLRRWLTDADLRSGLRENALARRASLTGWERTAEMVADALSTPVGARS